MGFTAVCFVLLSKKELVTLACVWPSITAEILTASRWPDILVTSGTATQVSDARKLSGRKAWCQSRQFLLDLTAPDCSTRRVAAKFCHGQCTSVYVPHGGGSFRSCPSCAPVNGRWASVTLSCHGGSTNRVEKFFRVKKCRCKEPQQ